MCSTCVFSLCADVTHDSASPSRRTSHQRVPPTSLVRGIRDPPGSGSERAPDRGMHTACECSIVAALAHTRSGRMTMARQTVHHTQGIVTKRDHVRGSAHAPILLVEYGDFECVESGVASRMIQEAQRELGA